MQQNIVVTGAGDGIGRAIAERFLANGDRVFICDVRPDALQATLIALPEIGGAVADVGDLQAVQRFFASAREWMGRVDVLVNTVGIAGPRAWLEDITEEDWTRTIRVNLNGMFFCLREVIPGMKERRNGAIVNLSTQSVATLPAQRSVYNVSKAAVEGLTRTMAKELGPFNIRCNAVRPGAVQGPRMESVLERIAQSHGTTAAGVREEILRYVSMRTTIDPFEIADTVVFLSSDAARHITGQILAVDGNLEWES